MQWTDSGEIFCFRQPQPMGITWNLLTVESNPNHMYWDLNTVLFGSVDHWLLCPWNAL